MMLLTWIKFLWFATVLITSSESNIFNTIMYKQLSQRLDGILMNITEVVERINAIENSLGENQLENCASCQGPDTDVRTSDKAKDVDGKEELVIVKRAFVAEKEHLKEFEKFMKQKIETKINYAGVETVIELKHKVNLLENKKADKDLSEKMQDRVSVVENSLNATHLFTDGVRNRTELLEVKMTEMQDSTYDFGDRLNKIESNVSTIMVTNKRMVSFSAQFRPPGGHVALEYSKHQIVQFNYVFYNDGGGLNTTSGVFTVPVSGVYQFIFFVEAWQVEEDDDCQGAAVRLYVDGIRIPISAVAKTMHVGQNIQAGNTYINYFTKGQRVVVGTAETNGIIFGYRTTFSGTLLY